jgi:GH43 family beta-xylosidase
MHSLDLVRWEPVGHALVRPDESLGTTFWAPEVVTADGRWYLYYSVGHDDRDHQLRVAVSDSPRGPFVDRAALTDVKQVPFAIDPHAFRDADGRWYLFHARDFLDVASDGSARAGTALVVNALETMERLSPEPRTVLRARRDWQRYAANRPMYGQAYDWHTLEGPFVLRHEGRYYCLYSGGSWQNDSYGVDFAVADSVLGPWRDDGAGDQPRVLRTVPGVVIGPGHCSVVLGPDERTLVLVYHAWDPGMRARTMRLDELRFTDEGPRCLGPTWREHALPGKEQQP